MTQEAAETKPAASKATAKKTPRPKALTLQQKFIKLREAIPAIVKAKHSEGVEYKFAKDVYKRQDRVRQGPRKGGENVSGYRYLTLADRQTLEALYLEGDRVVPAGTGLPEVREDLKNREAERDAEVAAELAAAAQ